MKANSSSTIPDSTIEQILTEMVQKWPSSIVSREKIGEFSGGLIHPRSLANLDSQGLGPSRMRLGRKIFYRSQDLAEWLVNRLEVVK